MTEIDAFDVTDDAPDENALEKLKAVAQEAVDTEKLIEELEENLSTIKKRLNRLKTVELPDLIAEVGLPKFTTAEGWELEADDFVSGSLPKEEPKKGDAIAWLEGNDAASLIKTTLTLSFGKSQHNEALALAEDLHEKGFDVVQQSGVHASTLLSFAKEALRDGKKLPLELLGLYAGRVVKIKPPKNDTPKPIRTKSPRKKKAP